MRRYIYQERLCELEALLSHRASTDSRGARGCKNKRDGKREPNQEGVYSIVSQKGKLDKAIGQPNRTD